MKDKTNQKEKKKNFINISPVVSFIIVIIIILVTIISFNFLGKYQNSYKNTKTQFNFNGDFDTSIYSDTPDVEEVYENTIPIDEPIEEDNVLNKDEIILDIEQDTSTDIDYLKNKNNTQNITEQKDTTNDDIINNNENDGVDAYYSIAINAILTNKNKEEYCSNTFSFENPFENIDVVKFTCTEVNLVDQYLIGYVNTPDNDILCRFDYTIDDEESFTSIKCTQL